MRKKLLRRILIWGLLILSLLLLVILVPNLTSSSVIPADDFVRFWAGAKLNLGGNDPYNPTNIERLPSEAGIVSDEGAITSIILNPPWALAILLPFGLASFSISRLVWLLLSIILIVICVDLLWRYYQGAPQQKWIAWVAAIIFAPTISVLEKGQITPFLLLGVVGFIYFVEYRRNDLAAGACLALASIKPQLIYLFWVAVLFWVIQQRRWLILISTAGTILLLTLLTMIFNPSIIQQYIYAMQTYQTSEWATPTFGSYLRYFWLGTGTMWPQFIPAVIGLAWLAYYYYQHASTWSWVRDLPCALLVSLLSTPYAWTYDHVILLPVIIQAAVWLLKDRKLWTTWVLAGAFLVISVTDLVLHMRLSDFWFIWLAPAMLIWYLLVEKQSLAQKKIAPV